MILREFRKSTFVNDAFQYVAVPPIPPKGVGMNVAKIQRSGETTKKKGEKIWKRHPAVTWSQCDRYILFFSIPLHCINIFRSIQFVTTAAVDPFHT